MLVFNGFACILGLALVILLIMDWGSNSWLIEQKTPLPSKIVSKLTDLIGFVPAMLVKMAVLVPLIIAFTTLPSPIGFFVLLAGVGLQGWLLNRKNDLLK